MSKDLPKNIGFYKIENDVFVGCEFADNKQIDKDRYKLQHDLYYRSKDGRIFLIKKGFIHDGASKGFLKRFGRYTNAAILHDVLYASEMKSREEADELFLEAMEVSNVVYLRRYTYYWAVRIFGGNVWQFHTKRSIKKAQNYIEIYKR